MPTQIIDASLHVAAFPATYTGPGHLIGNAVTGNLDNDVYGFFTSAGNAVQINCGFQALAVDVRCGWCVAVALAARHAGD